MILYCRAWSILKTIKTVVFDVDGVLVDVHNSFRRMISLAVKFYFKYKLELNGNAKLVTPRVIEMFKRAGDFNNDWDLTAALVYLYLNIYLQKGRPQTLEKLKVPAHELVRIVKSLLGAKSGGLKGFIESTETYFGCGKSANKLFDRQYIEELCMLLYSGKRVETVYGPLKLIDLSIQNHLKRYELYRYEIPLLAEKYLSEEINYGLVTGRTPGELSLLEERFPRLFQRTIHKITDDGLNPRKPSPEVLRFYVENELTPLLFVGDARDDFETVKAARKHFKKEEIFFAGIGSNQRQFAFFKELGADCVTCEVNFLLKGLGSGCLEGN